MKNPFTYNLLLSFLFLCLSLASSPDFSYYHTTDEIAQRVVALQTSCNGTLSIIQLLDINKQASEQTTRKHKAFLLFGEHAREMISPEAGLSFLESLCGSNQALLDKYHIQMILNANPASRKQVENGEYCLRVNENGVDLNRNWDAHWEKGGDSYAQTSSGEFPFSEPESKAVKAALEAFKPKVFLTVHSGAMGMYTPYAYSNEKGLFNENKMMTVLNELNSRHCNCNAGAAGKEVGYLCPGTCLDYAYDALKVPYAFAWEIYQRDYDYSQLQVLQQKRFLQINRKARIEKKQVQQQKAALFSCFVQTSMSSMSGLTNEDCFDYFNPTTEKQYQFVVKNWVDAMREMLETVEKQERRH